MFYVYVLFSEKDKKLYTGFASDLRKRYMKHTAGFVTATKHRLPLKLIYYECYCKSTDARRREKYLKGGKGKAELKVQLKDQLTELGYPYL